MVSLLTYLIRNQNIAFYESSMDMANAYYQTAVSPIDQWR